MTAHGLMTLLLIPMLAIAGCGAAEHAEDPGATPEAERVGGHMHTEAGHAPPAALAASLHHAVAVLVPTEGHQVSGVLLFEQVGDGVRISGVVRGLEPHGTHAMHIHEYGDLRSADGTSAGGHYNPEGHPHGLPHEEGPRHAGDLGNLEADAGGVARYELTVENASIAGAVAPILGRSVIVHEHRDDGGQPTGNAGGRIAMGVIGVANPALQDARYPVYAVQEMRDAPGFGGEADAGAGN